MYEDIVTQIEYEYDYDAIQDKYMSSVLFNNQEAITRYGGERSKITLTLPGLSSDDFGRELVTGSLSFSLLLHVFLIYSATLSGSGVVR